MDLGLAGRTVLITGASQGIGQGLADAFAEEGCHLRLVARSEGKLMRIAGDLRLRCGIEVEILARDITAPGAVAEIAAWGGDADVLVNNAGSIPGGNLWQVDGDAWRAGWELKVFGYIDLVRAFYPLMATRRAGVILNNGGNGGENFDFDYIAGTTGNAALMAFTRAIGGRSIDDGIRVLGVNPGPVATERIFKLLRVRAGSAPEAPTDDQLVARYPGGRIASVRETADLFVFLASARSGYTSGTIVTVDGGFTSRRSIS